MKKCIVVFCVFLGIAIGFVGLCILKQTTCNRNLREPLKASATKDDFIEKEKTVIDLYQHLKAKSWNLDDLTKIDAPLFNSKESIGFRVKLLNVKRPRGFLVMRFSSIEIAKANFIKIEQVYKSKFGGAILTQNFIVAFFGGNMCRLEHALSEEEIAFLQQHLAEFSTSGNQIIISKSFNE